MKEIVSTMRNLKGKRGSKAQLYHLKKLVYRLNFLAKVVEEFV